MKNCQRGEGLQQRGLEWPARRPERPRPHKNLKRMGPPKWPEPLWQKKGAQD